ncbi:DotU family type IV/VI secretion system protein [Magnetospirillum sulfuroxidans]|uniref:DotU family type IV/VI secretion system protein n=1 Tax=Magnetospirillum sulfuroxidans TaxID=611300 RepID=A0ABS5IC85_9PROT|nr:DotU family type IV/VI secretion system protein [Magnetospirillum sulfuroxidans]MBR9972000.1 DotU family type IV/VI secretion system protein [Magnetospirillum sulfuroxidans]
MSAPRPVPMAKAAIDRFLAFHMELVEAKRVADSMILIESDQVGVTPQIVYNGITPVDVFLRLRVAICPGGTPPPATDGRPDMGYVMTALADEAMLHQVDWPGREQWMGSLLEQSLYGSQVAGEEIFDLGQSIIDGTLTGRADLAATIMLALSLGFRGRYRDIADNGAIDAMRRHLFEHAYNQPPPSAIDWPSPLPAALAPVLDAKPMQRLPRVTPWVLAMAAAFGLTLAVSTIIWNNASQQTLDLAKKVRMLGLSVSDGGAP